MSNIHLKYRIYTYYLNFELFKYGFVLYYIATRNRHIIVALHRCNIVTRTDNCTAIFPQFLTKHSDIVIDNRHCMVTIHRYTIVTETDMTLKVIQIWVSVVSYCNKKQTYYCCITQMQYCYQNRQLYCIIPIFFKMHSILSLITDSVWLQNTVALLLLRQI